MKDPIAQGLALDVLCPMHVHVGPDARIKGIGRTLAKTFSGVGLINANFFDRFEIVHPKGGDSVRCLEKVAGRKLKIRSLQGVCLPLKGVSAPDGAGGVVIDLSFGINLMDAVRDHGLTGADFSPTDLAIEMLYLVEAQTAAMTASRGLNIRLQGAKIEAEERAFTDPLTGLRNRRAMDGVLSRMIAIHKPFALLHLDLDYFKRVNDTLGHAAGDHVLTKVAEILVEETREEDTIARIGGDEFVLLFDGLVDRQRLTDIATRLISRLERPILFDGQECRISASLGITCSTDYRKPQAETLLSDADFALYASKRAGRARHSFFEVKEAKCDLAPSGSTSAQAHFSPAGIEGKSQ